MSEASTQFRNDVIETLKKKPKKQATITAIAKKLGSKHISQKQVEAGVIIVIEQLRQEGFVSVTDEQITAKSLVVHTPHPTR